MNLYEINQKLMETFEEAVDQETGEIVNEQAYEALDALQMALEEKTENILLWVKNLSAKAEALKKEKQAFAERQSRVEKRVESLKQYVSGVLDGNDFSTDKVSVTWRKSQAVEYHGDISDLPEEYLRRRDPELNKDALKKALKTGEEIKGACLVTKKNIQIR